MENEFHSDQVNYINILNMTEAITFSTINFHTMQDHLPIKWQFKPEELYLFESTFLIKPVIRDIC
jgi:hypothetical protein